MSRDRAGRFTVDVYAEGLFVFASAVGRASSRVASLSLPKRSRAVDLRLTVGDEVGTIVGQVLSPESMPVPAATVRVRSSAVFLPQQRDPNVVSGAPEPISQPVRTENAGRFVLEDVPPGDVTVTAASEHLARTSAVVNVVAGTTTGLQITMTAGGRIFGTIRDPDGQPLEGVAVRARSRRGTTDWGGRYALEHIQPGTGILTAFHPHRVSAQEYLELAEGEELQWDPVLAIGGTIRGVLQFADGDPHPNATVHIVGAYGYKSVQTDGAGRFSVSHLTDEEYRIESVPPGYAVAIPLLEGIRPDGEDVTARFPPLTPWDVYVTGRLLAPGGEPAGPAAIDGDKKNYEGFVHEDLPAGPFRIGPIPSGEWSFRFETGAYPPVVLPVVLDPEETFDFGNIQLEMPVPVHIRVNKPVGLKGRVMGYLWGPGIQEEWCPVESGTADLDPLRPGHYTIVIRGPEVATETRELDLVSGRAHDLEIDLQPGVTHSLDIVVPNGFETGVLQYAVLDASGSELVSWRTVWEAFARPSDTFGFRPDAARVVVTGEGGIRGEAGLGSERDVQVVLR